MRAMSLGLLIGLFCNAVEAAPASGIDVIAAYAGTWKSDITHLDTPYSKANHEAHTLGNDCWRSGEDYVCHQSLDGDPKAVIVFAYDARTTGFLTYRITPGADSVHAGKLVVEGNTLTFPWQTTNNGKTTWFRVVNVFTDPGTIEFRPGLFDPIRCTGSQWRNRPRAQDTVQPVMSPWRTKGNVESPRFHVRTMRPIQSAGEPQITQQSAI